MPRSAETALLPAGLQDVLPPEAAHEAATVERLMSVFASRGYDRVKPPLVEFEESLLSGPGAAMAKRSFRLMDPVSHRMMALRADMTLQVARIAATRLAREARPLRLSYAGQVLRVKGSSLRPERQFGQAGVELIGAASARADAEAILLAAEALEAVGVEGLSIDLNLPGLVPILASGLHLASGAAEALVDALDRRDAGAVKQVAGREAATFGALLASAGPARKAIPVLMKLALPKAAMAERERLAEVVELVLQARSKLALTIDPAEHRGLEYHSGVGFTFFARRSRAELGRGGRYVSGKGEPSTGFTLYMDGLLRALPAPAKSRRLFVPADAPASHARRWRAKGWITVAGLDPAAEAKAEARRLGCSHVMGAGRAIALKG